MKQMNIREDILKIARQAKMASQELANLSSSTKNKALVRMAESIGISISSFSVASAEK